MQKPSKPDSKQPKQLTLADLKHVQGGSTVPKTRHDVVTTATQHCRPD